MTFEGPLPVQETQAPPVSKRTPPEKPHPPLREIVLELLEESLATLLSDPEPGTAEETKARALAWHVWLHAEWARKGTNGQRELSSMTDDEDCLDYQRRIIEAATAFLLSQGEDLRT